MKISSDISDRASIQELGSRLARHRLNRNLTQATLAAQAGISLPTVQRIEQGNASQVSNLVRILRVLELLDNLDVLVPEPAASPIQQARMHGKLRRRASSRSGHAKREPPPAWKWGDEP